MIQIRHVPDGLHRRLEARAAVAGASLLDCLLAEQRRSLERPTRAEFLARIAARGQATVSAAPAAMNREERDRR